MIWPPVTSLLILYHPPCDSLRALATAVPSVLGCFSIDVQWLGALTLQVSTRYLLSVVFPEHHTESCSLPQYSLSLFLAEFFSIALITTNVVCILHIY